MGEDQVQIIVFSAEGQLCFAVFAFHRSRHDPQDPTKCHKHIGIFNIDMSQSHFARAIGKILYSQDEDGICRRIWKEVKVLEDWKIQIAVLWLIYAAIGLGAGFFMLWEEGIIEQIIGGEIMGTEITPEILLIDAMLLLVPLVMAFLSLTLKDSINRWVNIIVGIVSIGLMLIAFAESPATYAILLNLSMTVAAVLIVWYAWKAKSGA